MTKACKPLTFAAMLVRAQRRFDAMGKPLPTLRQPAAVQSWPGVRAAVQDSASGLAQWMAPAPRSGVAG